MKFSTTEAGLREVLGVIGCRSQQSFVEDLPGAFVCNELMLSIGISFRKDAEQLRSELSRHETEIEAPVQ